MESNCIICKVRTDHLYLMQIRSSLQTYFLSVLSLNGPGNSVGIATNYALDGPGIESQWGEIFRPSRPALGPTQPPIQRVLGLSRG